MGAIFIFFLSIQYFVTLINLKPLIRYTQYSTYCLVVVFPRLQQFSESLGKYLIKYLNIQHTAWLTLILIPRLHQFFRKFGKYPGHGSHVTLINLKALIRYTQYSTYCIVVVFPTLHQFSESLGKYLGHGGHL